MVAQTVIYKPVHFSSKKLYLIYNRMSVLQQFFMHFLSFLIFIASTFIPQITGNTWINKG